MMARQQKHGFTIVELMVSMALAGLIAIFIIPKVMHSNEDGKHKAAIRDSFTVIGEAYLKRKEDASFGPEDLTDGDEGLRFAQYLYDHLNYTTAIDPGTVTAADYCSNADDYFVLPLGSTIRRICTDTTTPRELWLEIHVPKKNSLGTTYELVFPEDGSTGVSQERYTTRYGRTGLTADCTLADKVLNIGC